jgi:hypothetical protein
MSIARGSTVNRPSLIPLALAALLAASCQATNDVAQESPPPPVAQSPVGAMRLLEWSWENREYAKLPGLFSEDYVFVFASADSAGNPYLNTLWTREDELLASRNCFRAARSIALALDQAPVVLDDDRPGKDPRWHKTIRTQASLQAEVLTIGPVHFDIQGYAKFYFVRGDSALIPAELVAQGYQPDSTLWWIDRWEDETVPVGPVSTHPTKQMSWGAFKALFR